MQRRSTPQDLKLRRDYVHEELLEAIISGDLRPGEWIRERTIAEQLGVSTTPVKEAVRKLQNDGLLVHEPHRGVYVSDSALDSVEQMVGIRAVLEGLAAQWITQRGELDELRVAAKAVGEHGAKADEIELVTQVNADFHRSIREGSGSAFLCNTVDLIIAFDRGVRRAALSHPDELRRGQEEHLAIFDAVDGGRADEARQLMEQHILRSLRFVLEARS